MPKFRINIIKEENCYIQFKRTNFWRSLKNIDKKTLIFKSDNEAKEHLNKNFIIKNIELKRIKK